MSEREPLDSLAKHLPAFVLAGGRSRRFGEQSAEAAENEVDKARILIDGEVQIRRLLDQLVTTGHAVQIVADRMDRYQEFGIESLVDEIPGSGPMSALLTCLHQRLESDGEGWILLTSCDQLYWSANWTQAFCTEIESLGDADLEAICTPQAGSSTNSPVQPIPAVFHTRFRIRLSEQLSLGERSLRRVLEREPTRVHLLKSLAASPAEWCFNTSDELEDLLVAWRKLSKPF
ncbi:MAG: NTP transferase domain-containing protein [Planctomycetota bacterium]